MVYYGPWQQGPDFLREEAKVLGSRIAASNVSGGEMAADSGVDTDIHSLASYAASQAKATAAQVSTQTGNLYTVTNWGVTYPATSTVGASGDYEARSEMHYILGGLTNDPIPFPTPPQPAGTVALEYESNEATIARVIARPDPAATSGGYQVTEYVVAATPTPARLRASGEDAHLNTAVYSHMPERGQFLVNQGLGVTLPPDIDLTDVVHPSGKVMIAVELDPVVTVEAWANAPRSISAEVELTTRIIVEYLLRPPRHRWVYAEPPATVLPPLRQYPRRDGLRASTAARRYPLDQSAQASNRHAGGYY